MISPDFTWYHRIGLNGEWRQLCFESVGIFTRGDPVVFKCTPHLFSDAKINPPLLTTCHMQTHLQCTHAGVY